MTEDEVRTLIQSWENLAILVRHIGHYPEHLDVIVRKAMDDSRPENWRAMWMVDKIHDQHPELVRPYLPELIPFLLTTQNTGKKRHLLKLISLNAIPEEKLAILLNYCIDAFTDAAEPVAVRVHAMQILFNIAQKEPGFTGELIGLIEQELDYHGSAGIVSRGRKLLKKLVLQKSRL